MNNLIPAPFLSLFLLFFLVVVTKQNFSWNRRSRSHSRVADTALH